MHKRVVKKGDKVIYYPGLVNRLIEKGMDALKEKDGKTAYHYFLEAEQHERDHPKVLFGKMLSLVELGRLQEALNYTARLLDDGIGDYFSLLKIHLSLLIQLGHYDEAAALISTVLSEHRIPAREVESFYQLLHFSRQMADERNDDRGDDDAPLEEMIRMLEASSLEVQLKAITSLKNYEETKATEALVRYVQSPDKDFALKSIALRALHEKKYDDFVQIEKDGRKMKVKPKELDDLFKGTFATKVLAILQQQVENEQPFLFEFARQICFSHLLAIYPFLPEPEDEIVWAGVFHYCAAERLGLEEELAELLRKYSLDTKTVARLKREVERYETNVFMH